MAPVPSVCIGVHRRFQILAFPARRTSLPERLLITTSENAMRLNAAAIPARPAAALTSDPRQNPMHLFATTAAPPRAASAPPASPPAPVAQRHPDGWQNPMHLSRGSDCIASARQHPMPSGARVRCVGRACALSPMTPPSHAAENETMMRRPVRATNPEPTGTCNKPHRPTNPGHARLSSHGPPARQCSANDAGNGDAPRLLSPT